MTELTSTDFFTKKHARLTMIARYANVFAWIILIADILIVIMDVNNQIFLPRNQHISLSQYLHTLDTAWLGSFIVHRLSNLLDGVIWWLVLKGVVLGLLMIVETDVNYRLAKEGGEHE